MKKKTPWIETIRRENGLVEHICEHGIGHPAHGSVHWHKIQGIDGMDIHGCDGCCNSTEWQLADLREGLEITNALLLEQIRKKK